MDLTEETREVQLDREDKAQGTPSDPVEETLEAPSDPKEETLEAPSDSEEERKDVAGLVEGPIDLEGPVVRARRKLTISGNLPPNKCQGTLGVGGCTQAWKEQHRKVLCQQTRKAR